MYEIFEKLLVEHNVSAYRVAKETGITQSTLSDWKRGRSVPKADTMQKIANYFNVPLEYLLKGELNEDTSKKNQINSEKDSSESKIRVLCRKIDKVASPEEKETIVKNFENTIDLYLKAKGIKKD